MNCTPIVRHHQQLEVQFFSKFNLDLKIEAIHQYLSGNEGIKTIAKSLGINHEVLRLWHYEVRVSLSS
ncbi:transposase [Paenibacillus sp. NPDC057886]|uniref:transposase n=1 Tax=Paenibacillus sp. NPDC057886 TaxID=3346270 RepID=UPI0036C78526